MYANRDPCTVVLLIRRSLSLSPFPSLMPRRLEKLLWW